jgi:hypothetical protein
MMFKGFGCRGGTGESCKAWPVPRDVTCKPNSCCGVLAVRSRIYRKNWWLLAFEQFLQGRYIMPHCERRVIWIYQNKNILRGKIKRFVLLLMPCAIKKLFLKSILHTWIYKNCWILNTKIYLKKNWPKVRNFVCSYSLKLVLRFFASNLFKTESIFSLNRINIFEWQNQCNHNINSSVNLNKILIALFNITI